MGHKGGVCQPDDMVPGRGASLHESSRHVRTVVDARKKEKFETGKQVKGRNEPCNIVQVLGMEGELTPTPIQLQPQPQSQPQPKPQP